MTTDGTRTFHWERTTLVDIEANGRRGEVTVDGRRVKHALGPVSQIVELTENGFPAREEILESNGARSNKASLRYSERGMLSRVDADDFTVEIEYCD